MAPRNPQPTFSTNLAVRLLYEALAPLPLCWLWTAWEVLVRSGGNPPGMPMDLMNWYLAGLAALLFHGLGHLVVGALVGFRFLWLAIPGVAAFPLRPQCSWHLLPWASSPVQCLMFPTDTRDLRCRYILFFAGGPIFGLLLTALAVGEPFRALSPEPGVNLSPFLQRTASFGVALCLLSLQGVCLRTLLRGGLAADQFIATSTVAMLAMAGRRREDMDPGLLAALTLPAASARWQMLGAQLAYFLALEAGRIEEARAHLAHWPVVIAGPAPMYKLLQSNVELEAAYFAARHEGDAAAARSHLENAFNAFPDVPGGLAPGGARARSEAAVLLAEGRVREARHVLARASRLLSWREHERDVTGRVVLHDLRALAQEAASRPVPTGVDGYLDEISTGLIDLPYETRCEIREELRSHLISLVNDYGWMGHASEEAVTRALRQFGEPATLARALVKAEPPTGFWSSLRYGLCWFAGAAALFGGIVALSSLWHGPLSPMVIAFFVLPAVAGWKTGAAAPERAGLRAFYALTILAFTGFALGVLVMNVSRSFGMSMFSLLLIAPLWMPVGCLAAELSGARLRRLRRERQEAMKIARR